MVDIFDRIKQNPGPLGQFADYGEGYFIFPRLEGPIGPRMKFQGREVIFWSANDYLGLCNHPEVLETDAKAAAEFGMFYPMGARAMSGDGLPPTIRERISRFRKKRIRLSTKLRIPRYGFHH